MIQLRPYQHAAQQGVLQHWQAGQRNVLLVLPTGAGKTATFGDMMRQYVADQLQQHLANLPPNACAVAIAHRNELVEQMSLALNFAGVKHRIIASDKTIRAITAKHVKQHGRSYYDTSGRAAVASVDTLSTEKSMRSHGAFFGRVKLWVTDEAHHLIKTNKWGRALELFKDAYGLGVTATPIRADGRTLGAEGDGVFHALVEGPTMRELIDAGYLCDFIRPDGSIALIVRPEVTRDQLAQCVSASTGDYIADRIKPLLEAADIVGCAVREYQKVLAGTRYKIEGKAIAFDIDIDSATKLAAKFKAAGIRAEVVSSKTNATARDSILAEFRAATTPFVLVNVDLFGEGFDVPACDIVIMVRPTESYALYAQQFGRAARLADGKLFFTIIDMVGNIPRHGLPDRRKGWTLYEGRNSSRSPSDTMPMSYCAGTLLAPGCGAPYEAYLKACPYCGTPKPPPAERSDPVQVDGDLAELTPDALALLWGKVQEANQPLQSVEDRATELRKAYMPEYGIPKALRAHEAKMAERGRELAEREALREIMALWSGYQRDMPLNIQHRKFFHRFGVDYLTAQTLNTEQTRALSERVTEDLLSYE